MGVLLGASTADAHRGYSVTSAPSPPLLPCSHDRNDHPVASRPAATCPMEQMAEAIGLMMRGLLRGAGRSPDCCWPSRKGETVAEVAGAALAMRRQMTPIRTSRTGVLDTCGTGGDGSRTFNISTAAALVTAAAGVPVANMATAASPAAAARPTCWPRWA